MIDYWLCTEKKGKLSPSSVKNDIEKTQLHRIYLSWDVAISSVAILGVCHDDDDGDDDEEDDEDSSLKNL